MPPHNARNGHATATTTETQYTYNVPDPLYLPRNTLIVPGAQQETFPEASLSDEDVDSLVNETADNCYRLLTLLERQPVRNYIRNNWDRLRMVFIFVNYILGFIYWNIYGSVYQPVIPQGPTNPASAPTIRPIGYTTNLRIAQPRLLETAFDPPDRRSLFSRVFHRSADESRFGKLWHRFQTRVSMRLDSLRTRLRTRTSKPVRVIQNLKEKRERLRKKLLGKSRSDSASGTQLPNTGRLGRFPDTLWVEDRPSHRQPLNPPRGPGYAVATPDFREIYGGEPPAQTSRDPSPPEPLDKILAEVFEESAMEDHEEPVYEAPIDEFDLFNSGALPELDLAVADSLGTSISTALAQLSHEESTMEYYIPPDALFENYPPRPSTMSTSITIQSGVSDDNSASRSIDFTANAYRRLETFAKTDGLTSFSPEYTDIRFDRFEQLLNCRPDRQTFSANLPGITTAATGPTSGGTKKGAAVSGGKQAGKSPSAKGSANQPTTAATGTGKTISYASAAASGNRAPVSQTTGARSPHGQPTAPLTYANIAAVAKNAQPKDKQPQPGPSPLRLQIPASPVPSVAESSSTTTTKTSSTQEFLKDLTVRMIERHRNSNTPEAKKTLRLLQKVDPRFSNLLFVDGLYTKAQRLFTIESYKIMLKEGLITLPKSSREIRDDQKARMVRDALEANERKLKARFWDTYDSWGPAEKVNALDKDKSCRAFHILFNTMMEFGFDARYWFVMTAVKRWRNKLAHPEPDNDFNKEILDAFSATITETQPEDLPKSIIEDIPKLNDSLGTSGICEYYC